MLISPLIHIILLTAILPFSLPKYTYFVRYSLRQIQPLLPCFTNYYYPVLLLTIKIENLSNRTNPLKFHMGQWRYDVWLTYRFKKQIEKLCEHVQKLTWLLSWLLFFCYHPLKEFSYWYFSSQRKKGALTLNHEDDHSLLIPFIFPDFLL